MTTSNLKNSRHALLNDYDAFIIDIWGVIFDGIKAYPGVIEFLNTLIAYPKAIMLLSNTASSSIVMIHNLEDLGIHLSPDMILTSGDLIREQFLLWNDPVFSQLPKKFYHLADSEHENMFSDIKIHEVKNLSEASFILVTTHMQDNLNQYDDLLKSAQSFNLPMICANPDKIAMEGNVVWYCPGYIAEKYQQMGGTVYYYGKPYGFVYDKVLSQFKEKGITDKKRILMVGDTLETDILGARTAGIESALVMTGNVARLLKEGHTVENIVSTSGITPTCIIPSCTLDAFNHPY